MNTRKWNRYLSVLMILMLLLTNSLRAQLITTVSELKKLWDFHDLPVYRTGSFVAQQSTYDTTGGNNDGFNGTYSYIRKDPDGGLVMLDVKGPGMINRFTSPMAAPDDRNDYHKDTLDFYIDGKQALHICYLDLFSGKIAPFKAPLCGMAAGGYYCYFPILFEDHCQIVYRGKSLQFHQIQYRLFPASVKVEVFTMPVKKEIMDALKDIQRKWDQPFSINGATQVSTIFVLQPETTKEIFKRSLPGRITGVEYKQKSLLDSSLFIRITWDNERNPAIECPLRDLVGYGFGKPAAKSILFGTDAEKNYFYFPMPFSSAKIELVNYGNVPETGVISMFYTPEKRDTELEGKLYATYTDHDLSVNDPYHVFADLKGKGHYVATLLQTNTLIPHSGTTFFEGDDTTAVDGVFRIHGTGSEDYLNGGWYNLPGRWYGVRSLPLSGCLGYSWDNGISGGYRLFILDKMSFEKSFFHAIEHGPTIPESKPAHYRSLALYYCDRNNNEGN